MARTVLLSRFGGPEVLDLVDVPEPVPGPGEAVVAVRAAGVNPVDAKTRRGERARTPLPMPLGSDAAGVVVALGPGVDEVALDDEVIVRGARGAYATHVAVPVANLSPKPAALSFDEGAALGVPVGTAYQVLRSVGLGAGDRLLVHAGAGAVGQAAIQLAQLWGAEAVATASPANHDRVRALGATPVAYGDGLMERLREVAPEGFTAALDAIGTAEALQTSLALVPDRRRVIEIVHAEWAEQHGVTVFSGSRPGFLGPAEQALRAEAVPYAAWLAVEGRFVIEIAGRYPLEEVAAAHREVESGHVHGKLVLLP